MVAFLLLQPTFHQRFGHRVNVAVKDKNSFADGRGGGQLDIGHVSVEHVLKFVPGIPPLRQYCASREGDLGPLGPDFGSACDQIDRADAMLAGLRDRVRQGTEQPREAQSETDPKVTAKASRNSRTVTLTLDPTSTISAPA